MSNKVWIYVSNNINRFINKCVINKVNLSKINYIDDNNIECLVYLKDLKLIRKLNYYSDIKIINYVGINYLKYLIKENIYYGLIIFLCFIFMDVVTSYIVQINIITDNSKIRSLISKELIKNNIKKYSLAYSFSELNRKVKKIINDNPNNLEWMSITRDGMKYIIRVEERVINKEIKDDMYANVIAKKDAYITKINATSGDVLVRSGDYVKKGDTLISGQIKLYDEVKGNTHAKGEVYGNVWYEATIKMPKVIKIKRLTGKSRYNFNINNKILFKNKYSLFKQVNTKEIKILWFKIKIYKEQEEKIIIKKNTDEDAKKALSLQLNSKGVIKLQNVLKKWENDSTINYRIFVIINELVSDYSYYKVGEENDSQSSN